LFRGGTLVDGTGVPSRPADVLVDGPLIAAILEPGHEARADSEVSVDGKVLCPGFIDVHGHDDLAVIEHPDLPPKVSQGVTTVVVGNCGVAVAPMSPPLAAGIGPGGFYRSALGPIGEAGWQSQAEYFDAVDAAGPAVNVAALAGHHALRLAVCGPEERPATHAETDRMAALLDESLAAGAIGLSTGLIYAPGRAANLQELVELGRVLHGHDRPYVSHIRSEADQLEEAVDEALSVGEASGTRVHISHLKAAGVSNWGKVRGVVAELADRPWASADVYPYPAASTSLAEALLGGGKATPTKPEDVLLAHVPALPDVEGRTLAAVAEAWGTVPEVAAQTLVALPGGASVVYFVMDEGDIQDALTFERTMIGTDGLPTLDGKPHPRLWGTFPRVLRRYVVERGLLGIEEAVRRMTSLPADTFRLDNRGRVAVGAAADLVVFDPRTIRDRATYEDPHQPAEGIDVVMVNGRVTWANGGPTGITAGRVLRHGA
jgi:N-acyl-D-aspartate/D-glutamate deacylase